LKMMGMIEPVHWCKRYRPRPLSPVS
jgi:hypothetical protein